MQKGGHVNVTNINLISNVYSQCGLVKMGCGMQCGTVSLNLLKLWQLNFQQAGGRKWSFNSGLCTEYYNSPKVMRVLKMNTFYTIS